MELGNSLSGNQSEPQKEWNRWVGKILGNASRRFELRILNDIGRIDSTLKPPVEPQRDHTAKPISVAVQEPPEARLIAFRRGAQ